MKKRLLLFLVGALALVLPAIGFMTAGATSMRAGEAVTVKKGEVVDRTLFIGATTIDVAGTVEGDVFCAGSTVVITGTVKGDVICAAQVLKLEGTIEGDVRAIGQQVTFAGEITGNASVVADVFELDEGSRVQDVSFAGTKLTVNGEVLRDVSAASSSVAINTSIGRDLQAAGESLTLGSSSSVGGNVHFTSENDPEVANGAQVNGETQRFDPPQDEAENSVTATLLGVLFTVIGITLLVLVAVLLFPRGFQALSTTGFTKPGIVFLVGAGVCLVVPILIVMMFFSFVGVMLGLWTLVAFIFLLLASLPVAAYSLGRLLLQKATNNAILYALLGAAVLSLGYAVPLLGGLLVLATGFFGVGVLAFEALRRGGAPHYTFDTPATSAPAKVKAKPAAPVEK